jgi:alkaline phosphatase D
MKRCIAAVSVVCLVLALGATASAGGPPPEPAAFPYGVGSNDVSATRALLWTETTASTVRVVWSTDPSFATHRHVAVVPVSPDHDGTLTYPLRDLTPATTYYYRFADPSTDTFSRTGTFLTAPDPGTDASVTFAISGDQDGTIDQQTGQPCFNHFETFDAVRNAPLTPQFYVNLGDTIYSDSECLASPNTTVEEYRSNYKQNLSYQSLRDLRAAMGFYTQWDDHEVRNDWDAQTVDPTLRANGTQAFVEYDNMRPPSPTLGFYRHFRYGSEVELFVLDERSFRTAEAYRLDNNHDGRGDCTNPETNQPDLAPTLSQSWRDFFAGQIPNSGLDKHVPPQCTADLNSPDATILGAAQRQRFEADLAASTATFKLVINEDPIQQLFALPYDRWEGYRFERNQILHFVDDHDINNVVWLTTDIHAYIAHTVDYNTDTPGTTGGVQGMVDYTVGPVATNTFRAEINDVVGDDTASSVRAFLLNVNKNTCAMLGGDGNPTAPWYGYGLVSVDATTHTISIRPYDYTNTKIAANGVDGSGRDFFCFDYTAPAQP